MALNFKRIEDLLIKGKNESSLVRIIIDYSTLKRKIESPDNQSWYFKQGIESSKQRLGLLKIEYEEIRKLFNETSIDFFIEKINENMVYKSGYEKNGMNSIQQMHYSSIISENKFFNELIRLKSRTKLLMPIDYYLDNTEEFLKFVE